MTLPASEETVVPDTYTGITDEAIRKACARIYGDTWSLEKAIKLRNLINDTVQATREQAVRECAENVWRPIETAPKDRDVLLSISHSEGWSYVAQGRWIVGEEDQVDQPGHDAGFIDCECLCFFPGRSFGTEQSRYEGTQPTHWQPLPTPPSLSQ